MKTDLYIIHGWTYKPEPWLDVIKSLKRHHINAKLLRVPGLGTKSDKVYSISDYENWAKENIPNINVPRVFFMPTVKYLKERYNIEFKDKPQWEF